MMSENSNNKIWEENTWMKQARKLIKGLDKFPSQSKITIIMRHSQRNEPKLVKESDLEGTNMELTPLGEEMAKFLGSGLPRSRTVRLFHSPRSRCKVTAEKIYHGFLEVNGLGQLIGECTALHGIGINGQSYLDEFNSDKNYQVILNYLAGIYSPELWPPAEPFYKRSGERIWNQIDNTSQGGINLFVTHDFHIMIFRFGWFGLPPDERWVDYLGGFAFSIMEDHILLLDYGKFTKFGIPCWWKKREK
ncbi:MAG: histidine phosphatase family protein [Candidatus Lokiarchaeota archaeon]|nr:histidine phosphatase family protein [Candidatus Lokiarchaeota archaeon]